MLKRRRTGCGPKITPTNQSFGYMPSVNQSIVKMPRVTQSTCNIATVNQSDGSIPSVNQSACNITSIKLLVDSIPSVNQSADNIATISQSVDSMSSVGRTWMSVRRKCIKQKKEDHIRVVDKKLTSFERRKYMKYEYMKTRIFLGSAFDEWERQRIVCGHKTKIGFARHLLAVNESRCQLYRGYMKATKDGQMDDDLPGITQVLSDEDTHSEGEGPSTSVSPHFTPIDAKPVSPLLLEFDDEDNEDDESFQITPERLIECDSEETEEEESSEESSGSESGHDATNIKFRDPDWILPLYDSNIKIAKTLAGDMTKQECIDKKLCIAYNDCLEKLVRATIGSDCSTCHSDMIFRQVKRGTCLLVRWQCKQIPRHKRGTWASQPRLVCARNKR